MIKNTDICICCGEYITEGEGMICKACQNEEEVVCLAFKNIHIENSYNVWSKTQMFSLITETCKAKYNTYLADKTLKRSYRGMYIEWYLHNIGYWITLPFIKNPTLQSINNRCKHVDLEEH